MPTNVPASTPRELAVLDSVIATVVRSRHLSPQDAEDFRQTVYLRLLERDGDVFRQFNRRSSLRTYLFVVVQRMLLDWRNQTFGKWRPSRAAKRGGELTVSLDRLITRDGFSVDQAVEHMCAMRRGLDPVHLRRLAGTLPARRLRHVLITELNERLQAVGFDDPVEVRQRAQQVRAQRAALARALEGLDREDRRLIWLRYRRRLSVSSLAAQLRTNPKIIYRRFERILRVLRRRLVEQGVSGTIVLEV